MRICIVGGGPAGLYFAILIQKARPSWHIDILERNSAGTTFGWGVVFSDETMGHFAEADPESHDAITSAFIHWSNIDTYLEDAVERSSGHGFCGISRQHLLDILGQRCRELGVQLGFDSDCDDPKQLLADYDLVVAADGINSRCREQFANEFDPQIELGRSKYIWLGTDLELDAFTFFVRENQHGLFQAHAYPFEPGRGTFIVECDEKSWTRAGLDEASEATTLAYLKQLFARDLKGAQLLSNHSQWINFRRVKNARWHHNNLVLIGDAAHTAHFSIGSGTKLAMEDAIALRDAVLAHDIDTPAHIETALQAYSDARWVDVAKLQKTAQTSREWFENIARYKHQPPIQFTANLLMRTKRVTHQNLAQRDPAFVQRLDRHIHDSGPEAPAKAPMFKPLQLRGLRLSNRVVMSSMCQYSAHEGTVDDWHLVHYGARAVGGAGLIMGEMTAVSADARITPGCAGIYTAEHTEAWARIVDFVHRQGQTKIGLQLGHAGRKASSTVPWQGDRPLPPESAWPIYAPSALARSLQHPTPIELERADMDRIRDAHVQAAKRALAAGFDLLEVHMAHGYLLASFISPLTNQRKDEYGGSIEARMRYPLEVFAAVREVWPDDRPLLVRISASDWAPGGLSDSDRLAMAALLRDAGCDMIDVSSGQTVAEQKPDYGRMYQTKFADEIRHEVGIPTMAVGAIQSADHVDTIIATGRADLCALARPHLDDPYLTMHAAADKRDPDFDWPLQYLAVRPRMAD